MTELTRNQLIVGQQYTKTDGEDLGKLIKLDSSLMPTNFYEEQAVIYSDVFEKKKITYDSRELTKYKLVENVGGAKSRRRQRKSKRKSGTRRQRKSMRRR